MRSACPPIMYGCKYLSFSRSNSDYELLARRVVRELEGVIRAIGIDPCELCTYCWDGKED